MNDEQHRTNVLLQQLMAQFRTFGEGLDDLKSEVNDMKKDLTVLTEKVSVLNVESNMNFKANKIDHTMLKQMVDDLHADVKNLTGEVQRLDTEVIQVKRIK